MAIITPWYPTLNQPFRGSFVRAAAGATAPFCHRTMVYHCDDWWYRLPRRAAADVQRAYRDLLPIVASLPPTGDIAHAVYLPVPFQVGTGYAGVARLHATALGAYLGGAPIDADVVHAHVGMPSGWAALANARPDARVFVTEHASFLPRVLEQPDARAMYDEIIGRCAGFFAVGESVRRHLVTAFPHHADRISVLPNPISFAATRSEPVTRLRRWLYVGNLVPAKGVVRLLEAFAACHAEETDLTLTFVGDGALRDELGHRASALGVAAAVTFTGPLPPHEALEAMRGHDLLVHPSRAETFGMVIVEAIAAGLPVLVTRCGGPEETLAGIEEAAGEFVDVEDDPGSLAAGYRRLRHRFPHGLDLVRARRALAERYSVETFAEAQLRAWFRDEPTAPVGDRTAPR